MGHLNIPKISSIEREECEGMLKESQILAALKSRKEKKRPGNDGLPAEFYKVFWNDITHCLLNALNVSYVVNKLSIKQRRAIILYCQKRIKIPFN